MQTFDPDETDRVLGLARRALSLSADSRLALRRTRPPARRTILAERALELAAAAVQLRPLCHSQTWQPLWRADELASASAALQAERRLLRRMLKRT